MNLYSLRLCVAVMKVGLLGACLWFAAHDYVGCAWLAFLFSALIHVTIEDEKQ